MMISKETFARALGFALRWLLRPDVRNDVWLTCCVNRAERVICLVYEVILSAFSEKLSKPAHSRGGRSSKTPPLIEWDAWNHS